MKISKIIMFLHCDPI